MGFFGGELPPLRKLKNIPQLFKSFKFGNGTRTTAKKLAILEFKYLQKKKWYKQAVKSTRTKKNQITYRTVLILPR